MGNHGFSAGSVVDNLIHNLSKTKELRPTAEAIVGRKPIEQWECSTCPTCGAYHAKITVFELIKSKLYCLAHRNKGEMFYRRMEGDLAILA